MFETLESDSPEIRKIASDELVGRHRADADEVAAVVRKYVAMDGRQGTVKDAMLLLGRLRAAEHVPLLVQRLTFEAFYRNTKRPQTVEDLYPAVQALILIGSPAISPVLNRLRSEDGETLQRTGAAVLRGVLGLDRAAVILEHEIGRSGGSEEKNRLERALQTMRELP